ncbi:Zinc finger protein 830, partial [Stegodyphus mimosarum]
FHIILVHTCIIMSSPLPQKKLSKDDLRRLMKERRENLKIQKVDSPFAKYNNLGQLSCTICNIQIKSNSLWVAHVAGKIHKENAVKKKKGGLDSSRDANSNFKGIKRVEEQQPEVTKKQK